MRLDINKYGQDRKRNFSIDVFPKTETLTDVMQGVSTAGYALSPFVTRASHTSKDASVTMTWDGTGMFLANQPRPDDLLTIRDENSALVWLGIVDEVNQFNEERGNRTITIVARSRDGVGPWRKKKITTKRFTQANSLSSVISFIINSQGLEPIEFNVPSIERYVPHSNVQFADVTPWEALNEIGLVLGIKPYTDAKGVLGFYATRVDRTADLFLTTDDVVRIGGGQSRPSLSGYRLKWLDRNLTEVVQQDQVLGNAQIPSGFFKKYQRRTIYWSEDRRARAKNTYMRVIQSVNSGIVNVGDEYYDELNEFSGQVTTKADSFIQGLATASIAAMLILDVTPDGVVVFGFGASTGVTVPFGRIIRGIAEASLLIIMMSQGVGDYEVWGQPYDFVHVVNKTEAYNSNAPYWSTNLVEEQNDLVYDEQHATDIVVRELLTRSAQASSWDAIIVDDPRIEPGDILELPDGSRLFVTDYSRDVSRNSNNVLTVKGFRV